MRRFAFVLAVALLTGVSLSWGVAAAETRSPDPRPLTLAQSAPATPRIWQVVSGTADADVVFITQDPDGSLFIWVNTDTYRFSAGLVPKVVVDGGAGADSITVTDAVTAGLTIYGGTGDDVIDVNGSGAVYVDGGPGADWIQGGTGLGLLFGGDGGDRLSVRGDAGVMAGGPGTDVYSGGSASTRIFAQADESIDSPGLVTWVNLSSTDNLGHAPGYVLDVTGDADFRQRVGSDLTTLLSVPNGRKLLTALGNAELRVGLEPTTGGNLTTILDSANAFLRAGGGRGSGSVSTIAYNPYQTVVDYGLRTWEKRPPIVGLVHELVHALNAATGTMQPGEDASGVYNLEYQAIGLPFNGIDFRWTSKADPSPDNPKVYTENGFRALLGIDERTAY